MSIVTSVPLPISVCQSIVPPELALDQGAHDLRAEAPADLTLGQPGTGVAHAHGEVLLAALGDDLDVALLAGEAVLDGVGDEFGEGERERRRVLARQRAERARSSACAPACSVRPRPRRRA